MKLRHMVENLLNRRTVTVPSTFYTELGSSYAFAEGTGVMHRVKEIVPIGQEGRYYTSTFTVFFDPSGANLDDYLRAIDRGFLFIGKQRQDGRYERILSYSGVSDPNNLHLGIIEYDEKTQMYILGDPKPVTLIPAVGLVVLDVKADDSQQPLNYLYHIGHVVTQIGTESVEIKLGT